MALKQWLRKKWEQTRDLWNLASCTSPSFPATHQLPASRPPQLFADPTRARIIISTFAFVFVAAVITLVVLLQTQAFQELPSPALPPAQPPGEPCPWSIPCKRKPDVVWVSPRITEIQYI